MKHGKVKTMKIIDCIFGGKNHPQTTHGEEGDIIYPAFNGTNGWFTMPRWDLVTKTNKHGKIVRRRYIWNYAAVEALEAIIDLGFQN